MKYLKTYEYWLKSSEKTVEHIDIKDLGKFIDQHCKDFKWSDIPIYRGMYSNDKLELSGVMLFRPSLTNRESENTSNFYTWIIDNSESYKEFPKRSKSLICTSDLGTAETFGDDEAWRVIPFDGAKIGICSDLDLWNSFPYLSDKLGIYSLDDFNTQLMVSYDALLNQDRFGLPKTKEEFFTNLQKMLDKLTILKNEKSLKTLKDNYKHPNWINMIFLENLPLTIDGVTELFDPDKNGIKLMNYKNWAKIGFSDVEVWTDSDSILVHSSIAERFKNR